MYDLVSNIINHTWDSELYGNEQQYIYMIVGVLICVAVVSVFDITYRIFRHFWRGK